jgi:hypothetical protein
VDEDVGMVGPGSANRQFPVGAVHRVPGLEGHHLGPAELVEVSTELRGSVCASGQSLANPSSLSERADLHRNSTKS